MYGACRSAVSATDVLRKRSGRVRQPASSNTSTAEQNGAHEVGISTLTALERVLKKLDDDIGRTVKTGKLDDALTMFERVDKLASTLSGIRTTMNRQLGKRMNTENIGKRVVDRVGMFERKYTAGGEKFDDDRLVDAVLARALDERQLTDAGEVEREGQTVARVFRDCFGAKPLMTGCRAHGVEPRDFKLDSETGDSYYGVKITRTD